MRRGRREMNSVVAGAIALVIICVAVFFAFTRWNPVADKYELVGIFESANNLGENSPVRIAGVDVGKVKKVETMGDGSGLAKVTMEIEDRGLPIKRDATLKIRSRLFLEGNYFVELQPGSPQAEQLADGGTIPPSQTAFPVQFGQVLTALQSDTRDDLQTLFRELSRGYSGRGPAGFRQAIEYWEPAYRSTSLVNQALLGEQPRDLRRLLEGQAEVFGALSRDEQALASLVTDLNTTVGALAREDDNLRATIPALRDVLRVGRPALESIDSSFPSIRAFARDALPGAESSRPTLDAQIPFIRQARGLVSEEEARGLAADLRPTIPALAHLTRSSARSFEQTRALAKCQNEVLLPFSRTPIPDPGFPNHTGEPYFEEQPRAFVGLSGESRLADANTAFFRVLVGTGPTTVFSTGDFGERLFGQLPGELNGQRPPRPATPPKFRPDIPCELQEPPDLNTPEVPGDNTVRPSPKMDADARRRDRQGDKEIAAIEQHLKDLQAGRPTIDPLQFSEEGLEIQSRLRGLEQLPGGRYREKKDGGE